MVVLRVDSITLQFIVSQKVLEIPRSLPADGVETVGSCVRDSKESDSVDAEPRLDQVIVHSSITTRLTGGKAHVRHSVDREPDNQNVEQCFSPGRRTFEVQDFSEQL